MVTSGLSSCGYWKSFSALSFLFLYSLNVNAAGCTDYDSARDGFNSNGEWGEEEGLVRNDEKQIYTRSNVVYDKNVVIYSFRDVKTGILTSGSIFFKKPIGFGRVDIWADFPVIAGVWPAIWLFGTDKRIYSEIDLLEIFGVKGPYYSFHYGKKWEERLSFSGALKLSKINLQKITFSRSIKDLRIELNDNVVFSMRSKISIPSELTVPMNLKINVAMESVSGKLPKHYKQSALTVYRVKINENCNY